MSLFQTADAKDLAKPQNRTPSMAAVPDPDQKTMLARTQDNLDQLLPEITPGVSYHYASAGLWSVHDLLFHLLRQTGPAHVWIATWSMTEESVRMLVQGLEQRVLLTMNLLIDARVTRRNASAYAFVKAHADKVRVTACHAKVTVIENEHWSITINGSPNYTNNPRIEAGVITTSKAVATFHKSWIVAEMKKLKPFGGELNLGK